MEVLKGLTYDGVTPDNKNWEEKYKVIAPEILQESSLMSDSDDEGGMKLEFMNKGIYNEIFFTKFTDGLISEQPYRYLTADLMKSLRDDSLPIDVTRDDPVHRQQRKLIYFFFIYVYSKIIILFKPMQFLKKNIKNSYRVTTIVWVKCSIVQIFQSEF